MSFKGCSNLILVFADNDNNGRAPGFGGGADGAGYEGFAAKME
jgi:hypothetical protein